MRNFAVKFSILLRRFQADATPRMFLDQSPEECLRMFLAQMPEQARHCLLFAFGEQAFLNVLDREFRLNPEREGLIFRKASLDAESVLLAGDTRICFTVGQEDGLARFAAWLLEETRPLYRPELDERRLEDIRQEYRTCLRIHLEKHPEVEPGTYALPPIDREHLSSFLNGMTADALFKADAAAAVFGEDSAYARAWRRKELFRFRIVRRFEQALGTKVSRPAGA